MSDFGRELARLMDERGIGVRQLARAVYVNAGHISNLRSGKANPSEELARLIDDHLRANGVLRAAWRPNPRRAGTQSGIGEEGARTANGHADHGPVTGLHLAVSGDMTPLLANMPLADVTTVISVLRELQRGYVRADRMMGALSVTDAARTHLAAVETACRVARGADRAGALGFACRFMEFCGWLHQDSGDLACAMYWTDRALDCAMELGDPRSIAYTLMRKAAIATEAGNPAQGLGIASFALASADALTPRIRAVILRQTAHAHAAMRETTGLARDADQALAEATEGAGQEEEDRAPYCSPMYVAMETGYSMVVAGQSEAALAVLARSHAEWSDQEQARDYALCASRLATAYAAAGEPERACAAATEAIGLAYGIGSRRVIVQLGTLSRVLAGKYAGDPSVTETVGRLNSLTGSFQP